MTSLTDNPIIEAAKKGDLDLLKESFEELGLCKDRTKPKGIFGKFKKIASDFFNYRQVLDYKELLEKAFVNTVISGNLEAVKYVVNEIDSKDFGETIVNSLFFCNNNQNLEIIKYLVDDKSMPYHNHVTEALRNKYSPDDETEKYFNLLSNSCSCNNRKLVDYWLFHDKFNDLVNSESFYEGLLATCLHGSEEMLDYLLTDENMPFKAYKDYNPQKLLYAVANVEKLNFLQYLVFNFHLPKPENMEEFFSEENLIEHSITNSNWEANGKKISMIKITKENFEKRELYESLQANLGNNSKTAKKIKI